MSALITGASGYLGGRLAAALRTRGVEVHAIVRPASSTGSLERLGVVLHVDPGDGSRVPAILTEVRPQRVYHLAATAVWDHRQEDVPRLIDGNLRFAVCLAEAAGRCGAALVNAGSFFQHAGGERRPVNLYAVTKQAFEDALTWFADARGLQAATVILHDTYGPRDPRPKLFHHLRAAARDGRILDMTPGEQVIDLLYADDAVAAFIAAGAVAAPGHRVWLAAGGEHQPLRQIVERWAGVMGIPAPVAWGGRPYREREVMAPWLAGNPPPGWSPQVGLDRGLRLMESDP